MSAGGLGLGGEAHGGQPAGGSTLSPLTQQPNGTTGPPSTIATGGKPGDPPIAVSANVNAAAAKKPVRRTGKAQPDRPVRALWCLGLKNPLRKLCIEIVEWKYPLLELKKL